MQCGASGLHKQLRDLPAQLAARANASTAGLTRKRSPHSAMGKTSGSFWGVSLPFLPSFAPLRRVSARCQLVLHTGAALAGVGHATDTARAALPAWVPPSPADECQDAVPHAPPVVVVQQVLVAHHSHLRVRLVAAGCSGSRGRQARHALVRGGNKSSGQLQDLPYHANASPCKLQPQLGLLGTAARQHAQACRQAVNPRSYALRMRCTYSRVTRRKAVG